MLGITKKKYQKKTFEEKQKEVEALTKTLEEGVKQFKTDPKKIRAILELQALLPSYSFRNIALAKAQLPNAHFLASFNRWKELGRNVIKGQRSLGILAPVYKDVEDKETGEIESKLSYFIRVPIFDVSQTEGKELPIEKFKLKLDGESAEALQIIEFVKKVAEETNCKITFEEIPTSPNGYYVVGEHRIVVDSRLSVNHMAKTAVHELVHSIVHRNPKGTASSEMESVAEGATFVVCHYFGLDTSDFSFEYVKGWTKNDDVLKYGDLIQKTAFELITKFEAFIGDLNTEDAAKNGPGSIGNGA